ncbi:MAG: hypothetical protein ACOYL1_05420, partial [Chlamydiia bacterium]|jgi:hypothetical protein
MKSRFVVTDFFFDAKLPITMTLQDLRDELFAIDLEIQTLHLKKQSLIYQIAEAKKGVTPLFSPDVEKEKEKKLLFCLKKEIKKAFIGSCALQLQKTAPNPNFGVDSTAKDLEWLKKYAPGRGSQTRFLFTLYPKETQEFVPVVVLKKLEKHLIGSCIACVVSTNKTFFRKKISLYGNNPSDLAIVACFLENLAASVKTERYF